jgi:hypothetical protein
MIVGLYSASYNNGPLELYANNYPEQVQSDNDGIKDKGGQKVISGGTSFDFNQYDFSNEQLKSHFFYVQSKLFLGSILSINPIITELDKDINLRKGRWFIFQNILADKSNTSTGKIIAHRPLTSDFYNDRAVSLERHTASCFAVPIGCGKAFYVS